MISFCGIFVPPKKRKQASKTPTPLGAVGTINPIDQEIQKITNKSSKFESSIGLKVYKQKRNPKNLNKINIEAHHAFEM